MTMTSLPTVLSDLIELALADLTKCEASPDYIVSMDDWWHWYDDDTNVCFVCLAGAVMAQTLGSDLTWAGCPSNWATQEKHLEALDRARSGRIDRALLCMADASPCPTDDYIKAIEAYLRLDMEDFKVEPYRTKTGTHRGVGFKRDMASLIDHLRSHNL